jgi:hypothetical protein
MRVEDMGSLEPMVGEWLMDENGDFIYGRWERSDDATTWKLDFVLTYRRQPKRPLGR